MLNKKEKEQLFTTTLKAYEACKHEEKDTVFVQDNAFWYYQGMMTVICNLGLDGAWQDWYFKHFADQ